jgi:hypothetical protein
MPKFYLLRPDGTYSDAADYAQTPPSRDDGTWMNGSPEGREIWQKKSINQQLEAAFKTILPQHLGQPYLTPEVISRIMMAKVAVVDANQFDPTGYLAIATIEGLSLPAEMEDSRAALLSIFP